MGKKKSVLKENPTSKSTVTSTSKTVVISSKPIFPDLPHSKQRTRNILVKTLSSSRMVYTADDFITIKEVSAFMTKAHKIGFERTEHPSTKETAARFQGRITFQDDVLAERLFERLQPLLPPGGLGCNPNIRIYSYREGDSFGKHFDGSDEVHDGVTKFTVLIYLSGRGQGDGQEEDGDDIVEGGHTCFYSSTTSPLLFSVAPKAGRLLLHAHGSLCLPHEAGLVTRGIKYVLRTDVVYPV